LVRRDGSDPFILEPVDQQHKSPEPTPFSVDIPQRIPVMTKNLQPIQGNMVAQNIEVVAHIDPQHQKELDLVREYFFQGKDTNVPFTTYLTKKQKKNISK